MTEPAQDCPANWSLYSSPKRSCGRRNNNACDSTSYSSQGLEYSRVCGRIIGYQVASTDAFYLRDGGSDVATIEDPYVDGISLTYGNPRQHIWTFAAGLDEIDLRAVTCPCNANHPDPSNVPSFVGTDYFCETGVPAGEAFQYIFYPDDPLWDGSGCGSAGSACCTLNTPPWFCKQLSQRSTSDLELRICGSTTVAIEDTAIELIEIYVK